MKVRQLRGADIVAKTLLSAVGCTQGTILGMRRKPGSNPVTFGAVRVKSGLDCTASDSREFGERYILVAWRLGFSVPALPGWE